MSTSNLSFIDYTSQKGNTALFNSSLCSMGRVGYVTTDVKCSVTLRGNTWGLHFLSHDFLV